MFDHILFTDNGDIWPGGKTSWRVDGTAAAKTNVSCCGETTLVTSASPLAALPKCVWASAKSLKTVEIRLQVSRSGSFSVGRWLTNDPRMSLGVGTWRGSLTILGCDFWGVIRLVMHLNSCRSVSCTEVSTVLTLASLIFGQMVENASLYTLENIL